MPAQSKKVLQKRAPSASPGSRWSCRSGRSRAAAGSAPPAAIPPPAVGRPRPRAAAEPASAGTRCDPQRHSASQRRPAKTLHRFLRRLSRPRLPATMRPRKGRVRSATRTNPEPPPSSGSGERPAGSARRRTPAARVPPPRACRPEGSCGRARTPAERKASRRRANPRRSRAAPRAAGEHATLSRPAPSRGAPLRSRSRPRPAPGREGPAAPPAADGTSIQLSTSRMSGYAPPMLVPDLQRVATDRDRSPRAAPGRGSEFPT